MAEYMIVPTDSIDATADAIKAKLGSQNDLVWGQDGFADYVDDIPSGGTDYLVERCEGTLTSYESDEVTKLTSSCFSELSALVSVKLHNVTVTNGNAFMNTSVVNIAFPKIVTLGNQTFYRARLLEKVDLGGTITSNIGNTAFMDCNALNIIVLRKNGLIPLASTSTFNNTPFKSGGTGGAIYIPKSLYDHLGDSTSNDYKAATNWSTIDGYGTITWAQIEGSYYETHYADGTLIPT